MKPICFIAFALTFVLSNESFSQQLKFNDEYFIWPKGAPNSDSLHWPWAKYVEEWKENNKLVIWVSQPTVRVFLPDSSINTGQAFIVCPGGGYNILEIEKEGYRVAEELNKMGIAAIVLKYRHYDWEEARKDALRAIQFTKSNAKKFRLNDKKIGIMGFSAGAHLAVNAANNLKVGIDYPHDSIDAIDPKSAFAVAIYGGKEIAKSKVYDGLPLPPTLLISAKNDTLVKIEGIKMMYKHYLKSGVNATLIIFNEGGHGFGAGFEGCDCKSWIQDMVKWLQKNNL